MLLPYYTYPTPKLSPHRDGAFLLSPQKTHTVWFISILNYGDTENVLTQSPHHTRTPTHHTHTHTPHTHTHTPHTHTHTHTPTPHTHTHTHTTHTHTHTHTELNPISPGRTCCFPWATLVKIVLMYLSFKSFPLYWRSPCSKQRLTHSEPGGGGRKPCFRWNIPLFSFYSFILFGPFGMHKTGICDWELLLQ